MTAGLFLLMIGLLACGVGDLPSQAQIESGVATAQAAAQSASAYATEIAPTLQAAAQNASAYATETAPTIEAGIVQLATAAANTQESAAAAHATLTAAGIDGNYLRQKVASLRPDENGQVHVTFTETEVNLVLQYNQTETLENGETVTMNGSAVRFTGGSIIYTAQVTSPVEGDLTLVIQPYVAEGILQFSVSSADLSGQTIPPFLLTMVENSLNSTLNGAFSQLPVAVELTAVFVNEGNLTFIAAKSE